MNLELFRAEAKQRIVYGDTQPSEVLTEATPVSAVVTRYSSTRRSLPSSAGVGVKATDCTR